MIATYSGTASEPHTVVITELVPGLVDGGNLQWMIDGHYVIKSGNSNHDSSIDAGNMTLEERCRRIFSWQHSFRCNGDGIVDTADMTIVENNGAA